MPTVASPMPSEARAGRGRSVARAVAGLGLVATALILAWLARGTHAGLFSDSAEYLKLATHLRGLATGAYDGALAAYFNASRFPPLYPLVLAVSGATIEHHAPAFVATAATAAIAYAVCVGWFRRETGDTSTAVLLMLPFALSLGANFLLLNPVSEPLFVALAVAAFACARDDGQRSPWVCAALVALSPFARSAGVVLVVAYVAWVALRPSTSRGRRALLAIAALAPYATWWVYRKTLTQGDDYFRYASLDQALAAYGGLAGLALQPLRLVGSVAELLMPGPSGVAYGLAVMLCLLALSGFVRRLAAKKLDAFFLLPYVALVAVWPFPAEMARLMYVVLPVILICAWDGLARLPAMGAAARAPLLAALLLLPQAPAMLPVVARAAASTDPELAPYKHDESYLTSRSDDEAALQLEFGARVFAALRQLDVAVPQGACVYAQSDALVRAHTHATSALQIPRDLDPSRPVRAQLPGCGYVFLIVAPTRQHRFDVDDLIRALSQEGEPVFASRVERGSRPYAAVLLRFHDAR